ncbi:MAG: hypothetical protein MJE68_31130, partial [Proteobacteria bacterium]|nr:hypothetical protein [Pseudomonadota bacterium]
MQLRIILQQRKAKSKPLIQKKHKKRGGLSQASLFWCVKCARRLLRLWLTADILENLLLILKNQFFFIIMEFKLGKKKTLTISIVCITMYNTNNTYFFGDEFDDYFTR